jgi:hypothetical protein
MKNCIVSQIHIPPFDPQGQLRADDKKKILDLSVSYTRKWNPDACLILTGHGEEPLPSTLDKCDDVHWEPLRPQDSGGSVIGSPAQYHSVSKGIQLAVARGFDRCFKVRGDGIVAIPNMVAAADSIIEQEKTKIFLTQQTGDQYKFGDCYMYGDIDLLSTIWDDQVAPFHADGLRHTGANFVRYFSGTYPPLAYDASAQLAEGKTWKQLLQTYASFRNLPRLNIMDMRWNYHAMALAGWEAIQDKVLTNDFNFLDYVWGTANGWHAFDAEGNLMRNGAMCSWAYGEKTFYDR